MGLALVYAAAPTAGSAQTDATARDCVDIEPAAARLACYDQAFGRGPAAAPAAEPAAPPAAGAQQAQVSAPAPIETMEPQAAPATAAEADAAPATAATLEPASTSALDTPVDEWNNEPAAPRPVTEVTVTVSRVTTRARGQHVVYLDNGQIWQENFASSYFPVEPGDEIVIKKRRFGGYRLVTTSGKGFRVERVR